MEFSRSAVRRGLAKAGRIAALFKRFDVLLPSVLLTLWIALNALSAGSYIDQVLFFHPFLKVREAVKLGPVLDPRLKLVLVDDRTLEKLGSQPTFADWQRIAALLYAQGVRRLILPAFPRTPQEVGKVDSAPLGGALILGALVHNDAKNPRVTSTDQLPASFLLPLPESEARAFEAAPLVIAPSTSIAQAYSGLATVNLSRNDAVPTGYVTKDGRLLPFLGLTSVGGLRWSEKHGWFANDRGDLPEPENGLYYIDALSEAAALTGAVPAAAFFDAQGVVVNALKPALAERMQGADVVAFVPEAYSGGRFIDSPIGKIPSYLALVAILNSTLNHRFIYVPYSHVMMTLFSLPILCFLLQIESTRLAQGAAGLFLLGVVGVSVVGLQSAGWFLPCAQITLLGLVGLMLREGRELLVTFAEKINLAKDLEMGQTVQNLLLPVTRIGGFGAWEYGVVFQPYGPMSGDWFQVFAPPPDGNQVSALVAIGDVVGKGASAALTTATIAGAWHHHASLWSQKDGDITEFSLSLNDVLARTFRGNQNSTLCIAALADDKATLASIAAPKWIYAGPGRETSVVMTKASDSLGMMENWAVSTKTVTMTTGDVLIAYTDGVIEGGRARLAFFSGLDAITDWSRNFEQLLNEIETLARNAGEDSVLPDDFTLLVIRLSASSPS